MNNKNITIKNLNDGKGIAILSNDKIQIVTSIYKKDKLIQLIGFFKFKPHVRGRCELKMFLDYLMSKKQIESDYMMVVEKPVSKAGKTENNTFRMYQKIGFDRVKSDTMLGDVLKQRVGILIKKLGEPCKNYENSFHLKDSLLKA